jgi:site-specific recombinase XerD
VDRTISAGQLQRHNLAGSETREYWAFMLLARPISLQMCSSGRLVLSRIPTRSAVAALRRHCEHQLEQRAAAGTAWQDDRLVFCNAIGRPLTGSVILQWKFQPLLARAGLPRIRFHDLRHTAATLMLLQGIHPKVVSEMLGHGSVSITLDLYSHVLPSIQREAADAVDRLLGG